ncbi:hypothetical protein DYB25_002352 [Aphanomyces astaci]|uniref:IPT/TIG domain-containing protein n=1 Tax=Aphanomyces astaci TaxID=112090 RepID=A0A397D989_APHAT|nr:hypothetical protein DYB36_003197 [Aphanomyces astaci]RHY18838.1 hypothetical protein DYB25_002352 [Aphanomyces astaci]RHY39525.1 hypothetical protein DYB34_008886 [Aphanomyces astaci]RHY59594.1 hypothetical protein DYB38_004756 [Aphanomyces astaci]RHY61124.1 hypothetical protein DYB30_005354 [Aphanomyces astaci]
MLAPAKGPKAGGTELRIFGEHFVDTGQIRVRFATSTFEVVVPGVVTQYVASRGCPVDGEETVVVVAALDWAIADGAMYIVSHKSKLKPVFVYE